GRQLLTLFSTETTVNSGPSTNRQQFEPDNASSANGVSVVVWTETFSDTDPSRIAHDIFARRYYSAGRKAGGQTTIPNDSADERPPSVAMDTFGNFVVAYERGISTDTGNVPQKAIVAQRYNSQGSPIGGLITVTPADTGFPSAQFGRDPDVAMDGNGN